MDPNMNQNNQMGMVEPQIMNPQEQNQAQILNYNDVNAVAEEEKHSSSGKKVALFLALIGIILVGGGVFYTLNPTEETSSTTTPTEPSTTKAVTPAQTNTTCTLSDEAGIDDVTRQTIYVLNFDESGILTNYNKDYTVSTIKDDNKSPIKFKEEVQTYTKLFNDLQTSPVDGYTINMTQSGEGTDTQSLNVKVIIDLQTLDTTKLSGEIMSNTVTKADLVKGTEKETVKSTLGGYGYICQ